jgi:putative transcriptional regulator
MSSLAPGFLVAAPILRDPNFAGACVLMVEHSAEGALGFIVNRSANAGLRRVLTQLGVGEIQVRHEVPVMVGGPVSPETGWIVFEANGEERLYDAAGVRSEESRVMRVDQREDVLMVTDSLGVSASKQFLLDAIQGKASGRAMLVQGYAGWGPGQLEAEIQQGVWIPVDLDSRVLFDTAPDKRWVAALAVIGIHPASLPRTQVAQA